ncbi:MAG: 2-oxoacid:acceptor oxidoreductase subunit alpha [Deltaproteobacteria bacterium]|nr:MAG: 2-oxoacid:acceptor oxidoreductase subunit alpha [Deltaproteobacteria bacterium]
MDRTNIVLAGEAGQGIQAVENLLARILKEEGFHIFATKEFMSRIRGGANSTTISVSAKPVRAWYEKADIFVPLNAEAAERYRDRLSEKTVVVSDGSTFAGAGIEVPFARFAKELGSPLFANSIAAGVLLSLLGIEKESGESYLRKAFGHKGDDVVEKNVKALSFGYEAAGLQAGRFASERPAKAGGRILLNGSKAVALGAVAGGCNACFAYPMSPSTAVFTALAGLSKDHDIAVEQVEDEIGVINMAIGCWYAGGRALVTTSGGGFALMTEGVSLAGMTETPVVVHLAQRPGPATGLPTRTEQGDLNLALYAGHGTFPRIVLAPGNLEQAIELSAKAFNLADRYQVPVFLLTDQYLLDSYYDMEEPAEFPRPEYHVVETAEGYRRYEITPDGISPRGIPGFGRGLVAADSDEHDEYGRITEDLSGVSMRMKKKRLGKAQTVASNVMEPVLYGDEEYDTLIVGWGSTHNAILEAVDALGAKRLAFLFQPQLYPVHPSVHSYLGRASKIIDIENNTTGQLADLLEMVTGARIEDRILRFDGLAFSVERLVQELRERL